MTALQKLEEINAEDELKRRGYRRIICRACDGMGGQLIALEFYAQCSNCDGDGMVWSDLKPNEELKIAKQSE
jgi:DnaJ-class molecular chaperone